MNKVNPYFIPLNLLLTQGRDGNPVVFFKKGSVISFNDLYSSVTSLTSFLVKRKEQRWCLFCEDSFAFTVGFLALLHSHKIIVLPQNAQTGTIKALEDDFEAIISEIEVPGTRRDLINPLAVEEECDFAFDQLTLTEPCIEMFTSGTTGKPVRALKTVAHLVEEVAELERCFGEKLGTARVFSTVSHQHIYGLLFKIVWPLSAKRAVFNPNITYPEELFACLPEGQNNILISSPAHLKRMPDLIDLKELIDFCSFIFSSGGHLPQSASRSFLATFSQAPVEVLGSTETGGIAWRQIDSGSDSCFWQPFSSIEIKAGNDTIPLRLCSNYAGDRPGKDWVETGDLIRPLKDGKFELLGRTDSIVKIEGKRVSLTEIEERLTEHDLITKAAVTLLKAGSNTKRERIGAAIVLSQKGQALLATTSPKTVSAAIRQHLRNHFETVTIPRVFRYVRSLPENQQGKVSKDALLRLFEVS